MFFLYILARIIFTQINIHIMGFSKNCTDMVKSKEYQILADKYFVESLALYNETHKICIQ